MKLLPKKFVPQVLWLQIVLGIGFGLLNRLTAYLFTELIHTPLFMDCIWTIAASFFGGVCGLICAFVYHVSWCIIQLVQYGTIYLDFLFAICSVSLVLVVRLFCRKELNIWSLIFMTFLLVIVISVEGGILVSLLYNSKLFILSHSVDSMLSEVFRNAFSIFSAAIITRIPINFIDKTIAMVIGYSVACLVDRAL